MRRKRRRNLPMICGVGSCSFTYTNAPVRICFVFARVFTDRVDLELESLDGTFSSELNHRKSGASGKPALADVIDRTPAENPDPPSAYCEVHLNDRYIYRTRTKQFTPLPYYNAVSERFIRDWRMAKIVFVVRDDRDREHGRKSRSEHGVLADEVRSDIGFGQYAPARCFCGSEPVHSVRQRDGQRRR